MDLFIALAVIVTVFIVTVFHYERRIERLEAAIILGKPVPPEPESSPARTELYLHRHEHPFNLIDRRTPSLELVDAVD